MKTKLFKINFVTLTIFNLIIFNLQLCNAQMNWNHACQFAGNNSSYIAVPNSSTDNYLATAEAWIKPVNSASNSYSLIDKYNFANNGYTILLHGGKILVAANTTEVLRSHTVVPDNQWTHFAVTFDYTVQTYKIYINGVLDTSRVAAAQITVDDSLYIGGKGHYGSPYLGQMDEIRVWIRALTAFEILQNMRTSLGAKGVRYTQLGLSMTFQAQKPAGSGTFNCLDWSGSNNHGYARGVTDVDLSSLPSKTIYLSQCLYLPGSNSYLVGPDNSLVSPTNSCTLQAWIYHESSSDQTIIYKGTPDGSTVDYSLSIVNRRLVAKVATTTFDSQDTIPTYEWTHVAFTFYYDPTLFRRYYSFYVNGKLVKSGAVFFGGPIVDGSDSLYIGGGASAGIPGFAGFIDEVRLSRFAKTGADINDSLFNSMAGNVPNTSTACYNFDGYTWCNTVAAPFLTMRGNSIFNSSTLPPLDAGSNLNFQKGFITKLSNHRIPETGLGGLMLDDTIDVQMDETISDINVYVAINHDDISELQVDLLPESGGRIYLTDRNYNFNSHNITTIFNDQAPTPMANNTYACFSPSIRSTGGIMNFVNGLRTKGKWRIRINDVSSSGNAGRLYAWGIQFNNKTVQPKVLTCEAIIQGFYNPSTNLMTPDTVRGYIRNLSSPFAVLDSSAAVLKSNRSVTFEFNNTVGSITNGASYYLQVKHRNSIETWSTYAGISFANLTSQGSYDFSNDSSKSYGNNLVRVDNSPVEYAIYGGDVDQSGGVDLNDIVAVSNDASLFAAGYRSTDVTGNNITDLTDLVLTYNNSSDFVAVMKP